jgi:hypothetical protein
VGVVAVVSPLGVVQERPIPVAGQGPVLNGGPPPQQVRTYVVRFQMISVQIGAMQYTLVAVNEPASGAGDGTSNGGNPDDPSTLRPYSGNATSV